MKIIITVWDKRISPVFDTAAQMLLVEIKDGEVAQKALFPVSDNPFTTVLQLQKQEQIELLLCGALCRRGEIRLQAAGVDVYPFLSGDVELVIQGLLTGSDLSFFAMPGCRRQCCCRRCHETDEGYRLEGN